MSAATDHTQRGLRTTLVAGLAALAASAACAGCGGPPGGGSTGAVSVTSGPPTTMVPTTMVPTTSTTTSPAPRTSTTTKASATHSTTTPPRPRPTTRKPTPTPRPTHAPTPTPRKPTPKPATASTCSVPAGVTAPQVVLVVSSGSTATVRACKRSSGRYLLQLGPYAGHVGRNGVSWNKREGDNTTPGGTYALVEGFGNYANPGLQVGSWLRVTSADVWVEDPKSALYNTHQRLPSNGRWGYAEPMTTAPAYNYAQVIAYNTANVPGKGSGIFFHVDQGRGTAGCVSLPVSGLLAVMRWERSGVVMSIR